MAGHLIRPSQMRIVFLFCLITALTNQTRSQGVVQQAANSVGLISFQDKSKPGNLGFGTGTLIAKTISDKGAFIFIVTNRHVLPQRTQSDSINFKIRNLNEESGFFNIPIRIFEKNGDYSNAIRFDPDGNDLAVINISEQFILNKKLDYLVSHMFTTSFLLPKDSVRANVELGDEIFFIGYPSVLYDKRNASPIVRTGIISSNPADDYYFNETYRGIYFSKTGELIPEKLSGFLIDANVFNGSSGSLVFTKPKLFKLGKDGRIKYSTNPDGQVIVLGILTSSYFDIVSTTNTRLQLGGVISAEQIIKTMEPFVATDKK
jgi:hypothetical protein